MKTTIGHLEAIVSRINVYTKSPKTPWRQVDGKNLANAGNYHLYSAHGGWKLVRMIDECGGMKSITDGYVSKPKLALLLSAFIAGLEAN